jgi:hypothetical protein
MIAVPTTTLGSVAHPRRERHRIAAAHVHHHLNLIEQIRRAWKVESRGAPGLRRRSDAELAHHADHFVSHPFEPSPLSDFAEAASDTSRS